GEEGGGGEKVAWVSVDELEQLLAVEAVELLDVREADERDEGHIPGSRHLPYRTARAAAEAGLLNGRPVVTICESGPRAAVAASLLQAAGVNARPVLNGGIANWQGGTRSFRPCGGQRRPQARLPPQAPPGPTTRGGGGGRGGRGHAGGRGRPGEPGGERGLSRGRASG